MVSLTPSQTGANSNEKNEFVDDSEKIENTV